MIKTFISDKIEDLDNQVNAFMETKKQDLAVRTETYVYNYGGSNKAYHKATVFYNCLAKEGDREKISSSTITPPPKVKTPSPKQKYCPKCGDIIPKTWKNHFERKNGEWCGWKE